MEQWCVLIMLVISAPTQVVAKIISRLLDKWQAWLNLPGDVKLLVWSLLSIGLAIGIYFAGKVLGCNELPDLPSVLFLVGNAVWAIWYNKDKHDDRMWDAEMDKMANEP